MTNILLPIFLSFLLAEEDYFLEVILSFFITSLLVEFYCVSPYSGVTPLYVDGVSIVLILLTVWISGLI